MTRATIVLCALLIGLGVAIVVRTAAAGGDGLAFGYVFGVGLIGAGAARAYLAALRGRDG